jgi:hypothetical protein
MDPLVIVVTVVAAILSLVLLVVGVQTILVLQQVRKTLERINRLADVTESSVTKVFAPLQHMGNMVDGMKTGFRLLESFSTFLRRQVDNAPEEPSAAKKRS